MPIDWAARAGEWRADLLSKPPFKMFKTFPGDFDKHPKNVSEIMHMRKHNLRLYPNAVRWHEHKVDQLGWRAIDSCSWPDEIDQWDEEINMLIFNKTVNTEGDALDYLYKNDDAFKQQMDNSWEVMRKCDTQANVNHLWSVLHHHVKQRIWMRRIAGEHWKEHSNKCSTAKRKLEEI